jgi:tRNA pseudouridine38-40 synthase
MKNIRLTLAYVGTTYKGWQDTHQGPSIEETLSKALQTVLQHPVKLQAASRTDAGVHAQGQVVNFLSESTIPLSKLQHSLNQMLPKDMVIREIEFASEAFHPTLDAIKKEYRYTVCYGNVQLPFFRQTSWHFPHSLDLEQMQCAALHLIGSHDFSTFCNERSLWDRSPVCVVEKIEIVSLGQDRLQIVFLGDHFLYKMVRNLAGTLVYVGCGKLHADQIPAILAGKDRSAAGMTAPAHGLRLERVFY